MSVILRLAAGVEEPVFEVFRIGTGEDVAGMLERLLVGLRVAAAAAGVREGAAKVTMVVG